MPSPHLLNLPPGPHHHRASGTSVAPTADLPDARRADLLASGTPVAPGADLPDASRRVEANPWR